MNPRETRILESVVNFHPRRKLHLGMRLDDFKEQELQEFLKSNGESGAFDQFLRSPKYNSYQKAVLASQLTNDYFSKNESLKITPSPDNNFGVKIFEPERWGLCDSAEEKLYKARGDNAIIIVPPGLLVKFVGRFTALCYSSFSTSNGTFVADNWYSPIDLALRSQLDQNFDQGIRRVDVKDGNWGLMRQRIHDPFKDFITLKQIAGIIPPYLQASEMDAFKEYRIKNREFLEEP